MPKPPDNTLLWELLEETYDGPEKKPNSYRGYTYRASVPGGWLVALWAGDSDVDHAWGGGLTFVPDPGHEWPVAIRQLKGTKEALTPESKAEAVATMKPKV